MNEEINLLEIVNTLMYKNGNNSNFWSLEELEKQGAEILMQDRTNAIFNYKDYNIMFKVNERLEYKFNNIINPQDKYALCSTVGLNEDMILLRYN
jgi:hypothetical protein